MSKQFLTKTRVTAEDFVEAGGRPVLERYDELVDLLAVRLGPEAAELFAEPLISRGNDQAPPTISWYGPGGGEARALDRLEGAERALIQRYLTDHLRPLRALADTGAGDGLLAGALSLYGEGDVLVVDGLPVIVNWGLMPGGKGAAATARPDHYAATIGRYLPAAPLAASATPAAAAPPDGRAQGSDVPPPPPPPTGAAPTVPADPPAPAPRRGISPLAWVPLLVLLLLAGGTLAWLLMPGTRLFNAAAPVAVTEARILAAARAENEALQARRTRLQQALAGAQCRADGELILPGGLTPEGLTPPELGTVPEARAEAEPDAMLPSRSNRVVVSDGADGEVSLLARLEASTVMVLSSGNGELALGSGFSIAPGLIVTNYHVIEQALGTGAKIFVAGAGLSAPQAATVVKSAGPLLDTGADFALLQIADEGLPPLPVHVPETSLKLANVVAAGFPGDVLETDAGFAALSRGDVAAVPELTVTDGIVNTEQQLSDQTHVLMHSAALSSGNSGGPLVDMCGRLVGVNSFVRKGPMQNRGFALTSADLLAFLDGTAAAPVLDATPCRPVVVRPGAASTDGQ